MAVLATSLVSTQFWNHLLKILKISKWVSFLAILRKLLLEQIQSTQESTISDLVETPARQSCCRMGKDPENANRAIWGAKNSWMPTWRRTRQNRAKRTKIYQGCESRLLLKMIKNCQKDLLEALSLLLLEVARAITSRLLYQSKTKHSLKEAMIWARLRSFLVLETVGSTRSKSKHLPGRRLQDESIIRPVKSSKQERETLNPQTAKLRTTRHAVNLRQSCHGFPLRTIQEHASNLASPRGERMS